MGDKKEKNEKLKNEVHGIKQLTADDLKNARGALKLINDSDGWPNKTGEAGNDGVER